MTIQSITASAFATQLANAISARNNTYDVTMGPIPDLSINPVAKMAEGQNTRLRQVESLLKLLNDGTYTRADLEAFVYNEGITPDQGSPSIATLIFSVKNPTSDLTVQAGYPVGTSVDETTNQVITFVTLQTQTLPVANKGAYYNSQTRFYELPVLARSTQGGANTNVGSGAISHPLRPLAMFESVFNRDPSGGGRAPSSDTDLIEQYMIAITGASEATVDGLKRTTRDMFSAAQDYLPVYGNDPLMTRAATDAGAVDLWVMGTAPVVATDLQTYIGVNQPIVLLQQPAMFVTSVTSGATTYTQGVDYVFVKDTGTYTGSVRGQDVIKFIGGTLPVMGDSIAVVYSTNVLITQIASAYAQPQCMVMGRDLLIRAAVEVPVTMTVNITVRTGYSPTLVKSLVRTNIMNFVNSLLLSARIPTVSSGGTLQSSDVDQEIRRISGVDNVAFTIFATVAVGSGSADITIGANQYPTLLTSNLIIP